MLIPNGHGRRRLLCVCWQTATDRRKTLDNRQHLRLMAGCFSRRIHWYGIPVVHCPVGERKHEVPEEYLAKTDIAQGVFPDSGGPCRGTGVGRQRQPSHRTKKPMPYVNSTSNWRLRRTDRSVGTGELRQARSRNNVRSRACGK